MLTTVRPLKALKVAPETPPPLQLWQLVRDQRVREAEVRAEIESKRLEEEAKVLTGRQARVETELGRMSESEAGVKAHRTLARWWGSGLAIVSAVIMLTAWWTLNWYLSLSWEKALLALTLFILPVIGWAAFMVTRKIELPPLVTSGLGLAVVVCSIIATVLLGAGRMAGVQLTEEREQAVAVTTSSGLGPANAPDAGARTARIKWVLAVASMVAVSLLAIAAEIGAGLAFHEYYRHKTVASTVWPYYRERTDLAQAIADNLAEQEAVKRQPHILHAQLTAEGLEAEAAESERAAAEARAATEAERKANSLGRVVTIVLVAGLITVLLLLGIAAVVLAAERHTSVVMLDLSASTVPGEFTRNVQALEGVIERLLPETRLVVLGVTESSFSAAPIFVQTSPRNTGRFGEYMGTWRAKVIREWRAVAGRLQPSAKGTDILGALARASTEFTEVPDASKTLIILSDMRHVGRGLNLENGQPRPAMQALEERGLVARLDGVEVWMLGVHTGGSDIRPWRSLKEFWEQYFQRSGATVKAFSPNRRGPAS